MSTTIVESLYALGDSVLDTVRAWRGIGGRFTKHDGTSPKIQPIRTDRQGSLFFRGADDAVDAFGRLRVSSPFALWQVKHQYDKQDVLMVENLVSSASSTFTAATASVDLTVPTTDGAKATRQSRLYIPYQPGRSQLAMLSALIGTGVTNVTKRVGIFDDSNGVFFEQAGTTFRVVVRKGGSDTQISQASWSLDPLDGTGPSGITLDLTKVQLFVIDYAWLGVGQVRFGFEMGGEVVYVHEVKTANVGTTVWSATPALPVRYEIVNTATSAGATLKHICSAVFSESGYDPLGLNTTARIDPTTGFSNVVASSSRSALIAVRLKSAYNRAHLVPNEWGSFQTTGDAMLELYLARSADVTIGGASVQTVSGSVASEFYLGGAGGVTFTPGSDARIISAGFTASTTTKAQSTIIRCDLVVTADIAGNSDWLVLCATGIGGNTNQRGAFINYREVY